MRGLIKYTLMYENDQRKKIDTLGDFDNKTPTHMAATHAISKSLSEIFKIEFPGNSTYPKRKTLISETVFGHMISFNRKFN